MTSGFSFDALPSTSDLPPLSVQHCIESIAHGVVDINIIVQGGFPRLQECFEGTKAAVVDREVDLTPFRTALRRHCNDGVGSLEDIRHGRSQTHTSEVEESQERAPQGSFSDAFPAADSNQGEFVSDKRQPWQTS